MSTFGKALANGFSVSALVGRREIMELGGLEHDAPRVFLLSATHGGETHALAAARETLEMARAGEVTEAVWAAGRKLQEGLSAASAAAGVGEVVVCRGLPCSPVLSFPAEPGNGLRTLFMQEMARRGVLIPYIAPSIAHGDEEIALTTRAAEESLQVVRRVLDGSRSRACSSERRRSRSFAASIAPLHEGPGCRARLDGPATPAQHHPHRRPRAGRLRR